MNIDEYVGFVNDFLADELLNDILQSDNANGAMRLARVVGY